MSKFIDSVDMNVSSKNIRIPAGMYEKFGFRFSGTNEAAQTVAATDLGELNFFYLGKQRARIKFSELQAYNGKKGGSFENISAAGAAFSLQFFLYNRHPDDDENIYLIPNDQAAYFEWIPDGGLAAKVVAASNMRIVGYEKTGLMKYIYGWNRRDVAMVVGETTPEQLTPFNISELFIEYNTNIDNFDLRVDGKALYSSAEIVETLNESLDRDKIETYAASGFAGIDLDRSKTTLEVLNNNVTLVLRGSAADTISVFWQYFDFVPADLQRSQSIFEQMREEKIAAKTATGGLAAIRVLSGSQ